jgi:2',3'-cyclic-nucleotide 2'-phosphodiesterase (5'-nucleotidase family)
VDTGDLLFSPESVLDLGAKQIASLKANLYMKAYNLMGYDAFTPGELDLFFGVGDLIKMSQQANFPFLAANLINLQTREPVFRAYVIKEIYGMKIGLLGLISDRFPLGTPLEEKGKFQITDPFEAAQKAVKALKKQCQVIVAIAHMEADEQERLAEKVHGIHFVINGHLTHSQTSPLLVHHTQILIAGARGGVVGQVDLFREKKRSIDSRFELIPLKADYNEKPEVQAMVSEYKAQLESVLQPTLRTEGSQGPAVSKTEMAWEKNQ